MRRSDWDLEDPRDLVERLVEVVVEDHDRPMIKRQAPEAALELVAINDPLETGISAFFVDGQHPEVRRPATLLPALRVAGVHEEPVRPGVETSRVVELRKVLPDREQRLLRRVVGKV